MSSIVNNFLKVSWHAACRRLRAKLLAAAARRILTPTPQAGVIIHRLGVEVVYPRTQISVVVVGHLAIRVVHHIYNIPQRM